MANAKRNVSDFMGDRLDVKMFGAVGNGVTNDTAAIQNAIDWVGANLGGGQLLIPGGIYLLSASLQVKANVQLIGIGIGATDLRIATNITAIVGPGTSNIKHVTLAHFSITQTGAKSGVGISLKGIWNSAIDDVLFTNLTTGILLDGTTQGSYFNVVSRNRITVCTTGIHLTGGAGQGFNSNTIRDNRIDGAVTGILGDSGANTVQGNLILRNDIEEPAAGTSICIDYAGDNSVIEGNWVEGVAAGGSTFTGVKLRGGGNLCFNNKYSMVASGGTVTQLDKDDSLINSYIESSIGSEPIFQLGGGVVGALLHVLSVSGPARFRMKRADNAVNKRFWEQSVTTDGFYISHLNDALASINAPFHIDDSGAIYMNRDVYTGGAGVATRLRARSADETITAQLFAYDALGGYVGTLTNHPFRLRTNDEDAVTIGTNKVVTLAVDLDVTEGGTGVSTLAAHGVLIGAGAADVVVTGAGTAGQLFTSNGASLDPTFQNTSLASFGVQNENKVLAGPATGADATPTFRALVQADQAAMFTDRGDPAAADKVAAGLTVDSAYHDWDLSAIVPAGATSVLVRVLVANNTTGGTVILRKNGQSNEVNVAIVNTPVANVTFYANVVVACDANRVIEYNVYNNGTYASIGLTVAGWWK